MCYILKFSIATPTYYTSFEIFNFFCRKIELPNLLNEKHFFNRLKFLKGILTKLRIVQGLLESIWSSSESGCVLKARDIQLPK